MILMLIIFMLSHTILQATGQDTNLTVTGNIDCQFLKVMIYVYFYVLRDVNPLSLIIFDLDTQYYEFRMRTKLRVS